MEKIRTNIKFNSTIVELELDKKYEKKIKEEFKVYTRYNKPYKFKSFINYFSKDKKNIDLKVIKMVPLH